jgi:hypothetical protein
VKFLVLNRRAFCLICFFIQQKIDDPSGDSYIQNPRAPKRDPNMQIVHYRRNREQNEMIGIDVSTAVSEKALQRTLEAKLFFIEKFSLS